MSEPKKRFEYERKPSPLMPAIDNPNCDGLDTDDFYPEMESGALSMVGWLTPRKVCARCPAITACLGWAMDNERYGMWGGLNPWERYSFGSVIKPHSHAQASQTQRENALKRFAAAGGDPQDIIDAVAEWRRKRTK